jgi:hypothetical protein
MPSEPTEISPEAGTFRRTLVRVLVVQVITLLVLWALQARYTI